MTTLYGPDTFSAAAGTLLSTYSADWVKHPSLSGTLTINADGRVAGSATNAAYYRNYSPPSADYRVSAQLYIASSSSNTAGIVIRVSNSANTFYRFRYSVGNLQLHRVVAGTAVQLGTNSTSPSSSWSVASTHDLMLEVQTSGSNAVLRGYADGALVFEYVDATPITSAGYGGLHTQGQNGHLDNFEISTIPVCSGAAAITEAPDTAAASGNIVIQGAASITEDADTATGAGNIAIVGAAAITEGADTIAAVGVATVGGAAAIIEAPDTAAAVGVVAAVGSAAITEDADSVAGSAWAGTASASAAITEGGDSVAAVGVAEGGFRLGAAGRDIYARWAKERRKLEKELREASEREIQELVEELEPVAPPKAKATLATLAEKAQAVRTVEARAQFQRAKAQYVKEIARLVTSAREAEEAKRRQEEDEDNWLFMLMHAA